MKILVIDDDALHGESLVELFASRGHEAFFAATSGEAEWLTGLFRFDLSVIDFDMPEASGPEVARRLREKLPGLEVVIVSGLGGGPPREALGDLPFLPKPIDAGSLLALLDRVLAKQLGSPLMVRETYPLEPYRDREV